MLPATHISFRGLIPWGHQTTTNTCNGRKWEQTLAGHCRVSRSDLRTSLSPPTSFHPLETAFCCCNSTPQSVLGLDWDSRASKSLLTCFNAPTRPGNEQSDETQRSGLHRKLLSKLVLLDLLWWKCISHPRGDFWCARAQASIVSTVYCNWGLHSAEIAHHGFLFSGLPPFVNISSVFHSAPDEKLFLPFQLRSNYPFS